jgi:putative endonuclease
MQTANQRLGTFGESAAADFLSALGYRIIERNFRCELGEIDIIAQDGHAIVFVEVKTRSSGLYGHPFEAITKEKLLRMRRLALHWSELYSKPGERYRLDAVSVLVREGRVFIEHLKQIF